MTGPGEINLMHHAPCNRYVTLQGCPQIFPAFRRTVHPRRL